MSLELWNFSYQVLSMSSTVRSSAVGKDFFVSYQQDSLAHTLRSKLFLNYPQ